MVELYQLLAIILATILCIRTNIGHALGDHGQTNILCLESEREALLKFKQGFNKTSGPLSSWERGTDYCKWKGVECNRTTGHVISLDLSRPFYSTNIMHGEINSALLDLPYLTYLDLSYNDFNRSQLPPFLGSLNNLQHLDLSYGNFSGTIPDELGDLPYLTYLDLSSNDFNRSQLPAFLGSLNNLQYLGLSYGNFSGTIPDELGNLSRLTSLDLGENYALRVKNLCWLHSLSSLKVLDLSGVDLSNITDGWVHAVNVLPSLVELRLRSCQLDYMPPSPSRVNCDSLVTLVLSWNRFNSSAMIDWVLQCCHNLRHLDLSCNELKGEISGLTSDLSNHSLSGPSQNQLGKNSSLRELRLSVNHLNGTLKSILQFSQLVVLDVSSNDMGGIITDVDLDNFDSLRELELSGNHLMFNITREWIPPFQLEVISLMHCHLGPQFPKWIRTQKNLSYIIISYGNISDDVPDWFWDLLTSVEYVDLSHNDLRGHVPDLSSKMKLQGFDFSNNNFARSLPNFPPNIETINLAGNSFFGPIIDICNINISSLRYLDLSSNNFSGNLPNCLTNGAKLEVLRLVDNHFVGSIPDTFGNCGDLLILNLNNNDFSGNLPLSMRNCSRLVLLDVGNNNLSGTIPSWIEDIESLEALILSSNAFEGNIPITLCNIKPLRILDLSFNHLSGPIPRCNFVAMATDWWTYAFSFSIGHDGKADILIDYAERLTWKGKSSTNFSSDGLVFELLRVLDLSSNLLTGDIPEKITGYVGLKSLNLSRNQIEGVIPSNISNIKSLEVLDLSWNKLTGVIPIGIIDMDQLGVLDVSHNNLTGPIPLGRHLDTFESSFFAGNPNLCGRPLNKSCYTNQSFEEGKRDGLEIPSFYVSMGIGFITGFWGIWGPLIVSRRWRQAYFSFLSSMYDKLYVMVAITMAKWGRKLQGSH